jgi:hypothetical protein
MGTKLGNSQKGYNVIDSDKGIIVIEHKTVNAKQLVFMLDPPVQKTTPHRHAILF